MMMTNVGMKSPRPADALAKAFLSTELTNGGANMNAVWFLLIAKFVSVGNSISVMGATTFWGFP